MRYICFLFLIFSLNVKAQKPEPPVNSNYLIEYGISPSVLDAALSTTLQSGSFTSDMIGWRVINGDTTSTSFKFIYDPEINNGIDIQIVIDKDSLRKKEEKALIKVMERTHSFSRMSRTQLYDPTSLKLISKEGNNLELTFYFDKKRLEPELKFGKNLKGTIKIENGILRSVVVTNTDRIKLDKYLINKGNFERKLYFKRDDDFGGYFVESLYENYSFIEKGDRISVGYNSYTSTYRTTSGSRLKTEAINISKNWDNVTDTLKGSLGWALPLMGKGARKLGYKLPRPIGLNLFAHYQEQLLKFTSLEVGLNGGDKVKLDGLFNLGNSTVDQNTLVTMVKTDVWLLPFLNIMAIAGSGTNGIDGSLFINEDLIDLLVKLGVDPGEIPDRLPVESDLTSSMFGGGATLAGGVGNFNLSVNYQFLVSQLAEVNTTKVAHVISPSIGYMTPFGLNIMAGAQGQFYNPNAVGFIELPGGDKLDYEVGFEPSVWNYMLGLYAPLSDHWELAVQSGFGDRRSLTVVFGYRF